MRSKTSAPGVRSLKQDIKSGIVIFLTIATLGTITVFAANWYDSILVTTGETLTATKWNTLAKTTVPTGAIMAFSLTACPDTWTEYTPARGRFLRGIDSTGINDSIRVLGDLQIDGFQGHKHAFFTASAGTSTTINPFITRGFNPATYVYDDVNYGQSTVSDGTNGTPRIANETRPKNVAVLYCVKQ